MVLFARDIVEEEFVSLPQDVTALEAAKVMKQTRHGFVVVTEGDRRPMGIVTEWDYISRIVAEERNPATVTLKEIMSVDLVTVPANWGIDQVAQLMTERQIRRVLVLGDGKVIGVITARTMLRTMKDYIDTVSTQIARLQGPWG
jgi:CBS domain-containing protein